MYYFTLQWEWQYLCLGHPLHAGSDGLLIFSKVDLIDLTPSSGHYFFLVMCSYTGFIVRKQPFTGTDDSVTVWERCCICGRL